MIAIIYDVINGTKIQEFTGDELPLAFNRVENLRNKNPENSYSLIRGETREEIEAMLPDRKAKALAARARRQALLDSLPPVQDGSLSQEQWDSAMALLSQRNRWQAANLAAHNWAVIPLDDGSVRLVGQCVLLLKGDEEIRETTAPEICMTCEYSERYMPRHRGKKMCALLYETTRETGGMREVDNSSSCSGWKLSARWEKQLQSDRELLAKKANK